VYPSYLPVSQILDPLDFELEFSGRAVVQRFVSHFCKVSRGWDSRIASEINDL
jgi:hypothetical protein